MPSCASSHARSEQHLGSQDAALQLAQLCILLVQLLHGLGSPCLLSGLALQLMGHPVLIVCLLPPGCLPLPHLHSMLSISRIPLCGYAWGST